MPEGVDDKLGTVVDEWDRLQAEEAEREAAAESSSSESDDEDGDARRRAKNILDTLTPEEKAAAQKAALLRQYAYVDADPEELAMAGLSLDGSGSTRDPNAPPPKAGSKGEEKAAEERRKAIEEALKLDGKKKKHRKNKEGELTRPLSPSTARPLCHALDARLRLRRRRLTLTNAHSRPACAKSQQGEDAIQSSDGATGAKECVSAEEGSRQGGSRQTAVSYRFHDNAERTSCRLIDPPRADAAAAKAAKQKKAAKQERRA